MQKYFRKGAMRKEVGKKCVADPRGSWVKDSGGKSYWGILNQACEDPNEDQVWHGRSRNNENKDHDWRGVPKSGDGTHTPKELADDTYSETGANEIVGCEPGLASNTRMKCSVCIKLQKLGYVTQRYIFCVYIKYVAFYKTTHNTRLFPTRGGACADGWPRRCERGWEKRGDTSLAYR